MVDLASWKLNKKMQAEETRKRARQTKNWKSLMERDNVAGAALLPAQTRSQTTRKTADVYYVVFTAIARHETSLIQGRILHISGFDAWKATPCRLGMHSVCMYTSRK